MLISGMNITQDLNKLEIFREVAQSGSFTKAAKILKLPKSKISRHISSLEKDLGAQLIYRTTRQFQLTQAGVELYEKISPLLKELGNTLENLQTDSQEISGLIKITLPEDIAVELLGKVCHEFMLQNPKVQIALHATNAVVDLVKDNIDIAVRVGKVKDSTMIQKKLGHVDVACVMSPRLYQKFRPTKLEDLEKIPYMPYEYQNLKPQNLKVFKATESKTLKLRPNFASNNFFVLRSMVIQDTGFAFIPTFLVREQILKGELIQVFKDWKIDTYPLQILIPQQKEVPKRIRKFLDFLMPRMMLYFS